MQTLLGTLEAMRKAAKAGVYHGVEQRRKNLRALKAEFLRSQKELLSALHEDLGKSEFDGLSTEILMVNDELNCALRNLDGWCAPKKADGGVVNFPSRAYVTAQPLGTVLIYSPWNYPVQLALSPLVGAVAAGNSAVVKPSPLAPATARALARLVGRALPDDLALVTDPSDEVSAALLDEPFDLIFFTGGERFGRHVLECAAKRMTPVVLELGGKSPCIVDASADLDAASKRIVWGKFLNAGQTCVAPDYLLVQKRALAPLCERMERAVKRFYFHAGRLKPGYTRIINRKHFDRLTALLEGGRILCGGNGDRERLLLEPTILLPETADVPAMEEEIFGPVLPVLPFDSLDDAISFVSARPKPLALYHFTRSRRAAERVLRATAAGGGCINDVVMHLAGSGLPFGGVGESGMGRYHGKASFDVFSHHRTILDKPAAFEFPLRYPGLETLKIAAVRTFLLR